MKTYVVFWNTTTNRYSTHLICYTHILIYILHNQISIDRTDCISIAFRTFSINTGYLNVIGFIFNKCYTFIYTI